MQRLRTIVAYVTYRPQNANGGPRDAARACVAATYGWAQPERMSGLPPLDCLYWIIENTIGRSSRHKANRRDKMLMNRRSSYDYDELLACGRGELFGAGNAQVPLPT